MHPILFQIGPFTVYTYGVLVAAGVLLALWYMRRIAPRAGLSPYRVWDLGIYSVLTALVVSKFWLILSAWDFYAAHPREIFSAATLESGGTFYGGFAGSILGILVYTRLHKMPLLPVMDVAAAAGPLGHAIGRLGCFAAGCCYGKPTTLPWGVTFTDPVAYQIAGTPLHVALHPTQLYDSGVNFLNFAILVWLGHRQRFRGQIAGTYFILYGAERGVIEFFRGDPGRTLMFHDSISLMQMVSVALILAGSFLWWRGLHGETPIPPSTQPRVAF